MRLSYETGTATLIQFTVLGILNIGNGINSIVTVCASDDGGCFSNAVTSAIYFLLLCTWFGLIALVGYLAQDRRSKKLAFLLICAEGLVAVVSLFNAKHNNDIIGFVTSIADLILALWIIVLAFRLMRSKGQRITRRHPKPRQI